MSSTLHQLTVDRPIQTIDAKDANVRATDSCSFLQLFQIVENNPKTAGTADARTIDAATVGIPTVACQQDGTSEEMDAGDDSRSKGGVRSAMEGERSGDHDKNDSNNSMMMGLLNTYNSQADRRIFTDFEAAGLPRKEIIRLAHALHESVVAGRQTVSLGLRVPVLGELRFDVRIAGKVVFIHAFVESEQAAAALALAISTLREKLEAHKLVLGRLDVTTPEKDQFAGNNRSVDPRGGRKRRNRHSSALLPSLSRLDEEGEDDVSA